MSSIFSIYNTAITGMYAQQAAISVTSGNIANVNSEGYTRRTVSLTATQPVNSAAGQYGTGVEVADVNRIHDSYCLAQLNSANQDLGRYEAEHKYIAGVESVFDESEGYGLGDSLSEFWNGWQDLASDPSGTAERAVLVSNSVDLADTLNKMSSDLSRIQNEIDKDIETTVDEINNLSSRIADLNRKIISAEASGQSTNALRDELDAAITELSCLVDINTSTNDNGQTCVQIAGGRPLVNGNTSYELDVRTNPGTGLNDVVWRDGIGSDIAVTSSITGGTLGGALTVRDELIPGYMDQLDDLALTLVSELNSLLTSGYDINGQPGEPLFTGTGAGDIAVNQSIVDDPGLIAASTSADGSPGDGGVAVSIAELRNKMTMNGGSSTFDEYYASLTTRVGSDVASIDADFKAQQDLVEFYRNYQASVSGVDLDEESARLVMYQNAYQASAKVMTVLQEILQTVINM